MYSTEFDTEIEKGMPDQGRPGHEPNDGGSGQGDNLPGGGNSAIIGGGPNKGNLGVHGSLTASFHPDTKNQISVKADTGTHAAHANA